MLKLWMVVQREKCLFTNRIKIRQIITNLSLRLQMDGFQSYSKSSLDYHVSNYF